MMADNQQGGIIKGTREFLSDLMQAAEVKRELDYFLAVKGYRVIGQAALTTYLWRVLTPSGWHESPFHTPGEAYRKAIGIVFGEKETKVLTEPVPETTQLSEKPNV